MTTSSPNGEDGTQSNRVLQPLLRIPMFYRVLRIPMFYRVLISNSLIIFVGATVGTWLATRLQTNPYPLILVIFVTLGWLVSVVLNFVLLQIAFRPLLDLGKVMNRVQSGERSLRAPLTGLEPQADQLARTFNMMLEAINDANRQRATQIINAQEEERKRVARELHDETSQVLTSLLISLAVLEESISSPEARSRIADTRLLAHQTLRAIRNLSLDLRPSALDDLGLLPALRWYIKEYQQKFSLPVNFQASGLKERLPTEIETVVYRIVQEALTNIAKHAHAHNVLVRVEGDAETIQITICDDGRGFDTERHQQMLEPGQEHGCGLVGMRERASLLGGTLEITSKPGHGTTIHTRVPIQALHNFKEPILSNATDQLQI